MRIDLGVFSQDELDRLANILDIQTRHARSANPGRCFHADRGQLPQAINLTSKGQALCFNLEPRWETDGCPFRLVSQAPGRPTGITAD
ncbi:MAG: hypothetical protein U5L05_02915 [Rubrivivax sp.]|nr:hypothetical protein [Rubrivivax sp.]